MTATGAKNGCGDGGLVLETPFYTPEVVRGRSNGNRSDDEVLGITSMHTFNSFPSQLWLSANGLHGKRQGHQC
jgi:hypothetical protein